MALAVHVGCQRAADRHLARTRGDVHEPAERDHGAHDRLEADAGIDADDAPFDVDLVEPGEGGGIEHHATGVLRRVAVAAAETARDQPPTTGARQSGVDVRRVVYLDDAWPRWARCGSTR